MLDLASIDRTLAERLATERDEVVVIFERQLASELSAVNGLCLHIEQYRGKMLRPTLVLLAGVAGVGHADVLDDRHRRVAAVVEMIHMATLVHDDVLDEAEIRRSGRTVNALWGNEAAVMLGDYLISNAFHLCSTIGDPAINLALGEITNTLCEGELSQLQHRNSYGVDEATYFEIIRRKTASLIGECCRLGGWLSGASPEICAELRRAGDALGVAFQIQDDVLDLVGDEATVGKSLGRDLEKGKVTLPLIYALDRAEPSDRGDILRLVRAGEAEALRTRLIDTGAVNASRRVARTYVDDAKSALSALPPSSARRLFEHLADSVVERQR